MTHKVDCRNCVYLRPKLLAGYRHHGEYVQPRVVYECVKTFKIIKTLQRECGEYVDKNQTTLFGKPIGRVNE